MSFSKKTVNNSKKLVKKKPKMYNASKKKKISGGTGLLQYKVMSYNVLARGATHYQEQHHHFSFKNNTPQSPVFAKKPLQFEHIEQTIERYKKIKTEIETNNPDIILLQEVDNYFFTYILKHLPTYSGFFEVFIPSVSGDLSSNFATAVLWKVDTFVMVDHITLDSKKWSEMNSNKEIGFANKNATLVRLKEKTALEETLVVVSMHLSGDQQHINTSTPEKQNLVRFVIEVLKDYDDVKYKLIGGDLNCPIIGETACYKFIEEEMSKIKLAQIKQTDNVVSTCSFDYVDPHAPSLIDSIFYNDKLTLESYDIQQLNCPENPSVYKNGDAYYAEIVNGSDHAWIMSTFKKVL